MILSYSVKLTTELGALTYRTIQFSRNNDAVASKTGYKLVSSGFRGQKSGADFFSVNQRLSFLVALQVFTGSGGSQSLLPSIATSMRRSQNGS